MSYQFSSSISKLLKEVPNPVRKPGIQNQRFVVEKFLNAYLDTFQLKVDDVPRQLKEAGRIIDFVI
jgi:hypothetical protein